MTHLLEASNISNCPDYTTVGPDSQERGRTRSEKPVKPEGFTGSETVKEREKLARDRAAGEREGARPASRYNNPPSAKTDDSGFAGNVILLAAK